MSELFTTSFPLGRSLALMAKGYFGALTKRLEHLEIERYYSILLLIHKNGKTCSQQFICDKLHIDKVSMVRIIDYFVQKGYVIKVLNPDDRREYFIRLTRKALRIMPELYTAIEEMNNVAMKGFSEQEQKAFYEQLKMIQQNLESLPSEKIYINYKKANKKI